MGSIYLPFREGQAVIAISTRATQIGIILVGTSRLLRDVVKAIVEDEPYLDVVAEFDDEFKLAAASRLTDADCIVAAIDGSTEELTSAYAPLIRQRPQLRVVGIVEGGRRCLVYELVPRCSVVGELSPEILVRTIRREEPNTPGQRHGLC
jgi:hypothetical protein